MESDKKRYICELCSESFRRKHYYQNHKLTKCKKINLKINLDVLTNYESPFKKIRVGNKKGVAS